MTNKNETHLSMAERIIDFNRGLTYSGQLPTGFAVLNPYTDNPETMEVMGAFYRKFYADNHRSDGLAPLLRAAGAKRALRAGRTPACHPAAPGAGCGSARARRPACQRMDRRAGGFRQQGRTWAGLKKINFHAAGRLPDGSWRARNPSREFPAGEPQPNAASPILKGRLSRRLPLAPPASARIFVKNRSKLKGVKMPSSAISTRTYCYE